MKNCFSELPDLLPIQKFRLHGINIILMQGVVDLCKQLAKAYPDLVTIESAGKSYQGRDIIVLTISDKKVQDPG